MLSLVKLQSKWFLSYAAMQHWLWIPRISVLLNNPFTFSSKVVQLGQQWRRGVLTGIWFVFFYVLDVCLIFFTSSRLFYMFFFILIRYSHVFSFSDNLNSTHSLPLALLSTFLCTSLVAHVCHGVVFDPRVTCGKQHFKAAGIGTRCYTPMFNGGFRRDLGLTTWSFAGGATQNNWKGQQG